MPSKAKKSAHDLSGSPAIPKELVSLFLKGPMTGEAINAAGLAFKKSLAMRRDGSREILGIWIETTEGAKFWMKVFNDLKTRGVADILIAVADGLKGMPEALAAIYPRTTLQTCVVHLTRNSLDYASWKDRKALAAALRPIYTAASAEAALAALDEFERGE